MTEVSSHEHSRHASHHAEKRESVNYRLYYYLIKPGIVYSNVMTGASGYLLASKWHIHFFKLIALLLGMGLLIAASCVFNNYIDRGLDSRMERTKKRATVSGEIKPRQILSYGTTLMALGFLLLLATNKLTLLLGFLAVIFYVVIYGIAKRKTVHGTLVGALPGGASLVAGYCAYTGKFTFGAVMLLLIMVFWQMAHFYAIAVYRLKDYTAAGLPLWPIKRGIQSTVKQIRMYIMAFLFAAFLLTVLGYAGYSFLAVMVVAGGYWLNLAHKTTDANTQEAWAKHVFLCSLVVLLLMSAMLPVSRIIP